MAAQARRIAELERQLAEARGLGASGGGGGGPFGGSDARGGSGGGSSRARPGDWACPSCSFFPCFARAAACFRCGARRAGGGGGGGGQRPDGARARPPWRGDRGAGGGPIGADGRRPLLGGRGPRVAATTSAATAAAAAAPGPWRATGTAGIAPPGSAAAGGGARPRVGGSANAALRASQAEDADGFRQLVGRGTATSAVAAAAANPTAAAAVPPPWRAAAADAEGIDVDYDMAGAEEAVDEDGISGDAADVDWWGDEGDEEADGDGSAGAEGSGEQRSAEELRREWDLAAEAVRVLERNGRKFPQRVMEAARAERDEAERAWRAARRPHPLHKRLRWAEAALNAAIAKQRANREEAEAYAAEVERQRERMAKRAEEDDARVRKRRARLDQLREEEEKEGDGATGGGLHADGGIRAMHEAAEGIASAAPRVAAAIEALQDPAAKEALQAALVALTNAHGGLQSAAAGGEARRQPSWARTLPWAHDEEDAQRAGWAVRRPSPIVEATKGILAAAKADGGGGGATLAHQRWSRTRGAEHSEGGPAAKRAAWADETEGTLIDAAPLLADGPAAGGGAPATPSLEAAERARHCVLRLDAEHAARVAADAGAAAAAAQAAADAAAAELADADRRKEEVIRQQQARVAEANERQRQEELRQREQLLASMSEDERRRAEVLHQQQQAIAAPGFGTADAGALAGQVFGARVMEVVELVRANGVTADPQHLQALTPEKLEEYAALHSGAAYDSL